MVTFNSKYVTPYFYCKIYSSKCYYEVTMNTRNYTNTKCRNYCYIWKLNKWMTMPNCHNQLNWGLSSYHKVMFCFPRGSLELRTISLFRWKWKFCRFQSGTLLDNSDNILYTLLDNSDNILYTRYIRYLSKQVSHVWCLAQECYSHLKVDFNGFCKC